MITAEHLRLESMRRLPPQRLAEVEDFLEASVIKPVFATVEQRLVIRVLGRLSFTDRITLRDAVGEALG